MKDRVRFRSPKFTALNFRNSPDFGNSSDFENSYHFGTSYDCRNSSDFRKPHDFRNALDSRNSHDFRKCLVRFRSPEFAGFQEFVCFRKFVRFRKFTYIDPDLRSSFVYLNCDHATVYRILLHDERGPRAVNVSPGTPVNTQPASPHTQWTA